MVRPSFGSSRSTGTGIEDLLLSAAMEVGGRRRGSVELFWDESNWQPLCSISHKSPRRGGAIEILHGGGARRPTSSRSAGGRRHNLLHCKHLRQRPHAASEPSRMSAPEAGRP